MGCFSLRSLLLAAIVISNCITWTASRHSYTHNVSGHRRRHRRQGAGQYLPNSYVIPGGEGSEKGWGPWSEPASCSRTCGGGVASQKRICLTLGSGANCTGGDTKYFSCNTQECPSPSDFRAEQCAEFNDIAFKSIKYSWVPYTNGPRQCELNCMPKGERFYYRQAAKVKDGTRCSDESFDVCVDGTCQRVGCDMMLGSDARADKCQQCRGNGTNCYTNADIIDKQDYTQGYTDILLIPEGAMNIIIEEIDKSNNYLALRSKEDGKYYLNGDYQISFPHKLQIAGVLWHYERSVQGFAAPDKLRSLGPINESLYLSLLTQEPNVGIKYEYSILGDKSTPPTNQNYTWSHEQFSPCSVTCGTGFQTRNVTCRTSDDLEVVDDSLCEPGMRPIANETCQLAECMPEWVPSPWGPCSKLCGTGGSQSRSVQCQKIISNGYPSIVDENQCFRRLGDKPEEHQKCNVNVSCPTWFTGPWKPCDKLCGDGKQTRQVVCHRKTDGRVEVLVDESCEDVKPDTEQPCNIHPCDGIDWVVSNWTGCDSCVSKYYTREALCVTKDRQVVKPELCSYHRKPELQKPCNESELPPCDPQWYATQWSNCSVDCGVGVKTRKVFCGFLDNGAVLEVEDSKCNAEEKYNDTTPCEVPDHNCPARWYAATWSECTKECDGGDQFRKVMCLSGGSNPVCPEADMPDEEQSCNREPCNIDELLSVSSTTVMDDDDLPDCEEEDEEVGAELLTSTSLSDMMFSDASSVTEGSGSTETEFDFSSFSTVTGSDITEEGSGETEFTTESTGSESTVSTEETDSTVSTATGETSTASDVTGESTETSVSDLTEDTDSTVAGETTTADSTVTGESTISSSTVAGETASSGSTVAGETTSSGSTVAGETTTPGSTVSGETTVSGSTSVSSSDSSESSSSTSEGSSTTPSSGSTGTSSSGATDSEAGTTGSTVSGATSDSTTDASTDLTSPSSSTETTSSELTSPSSSTSESTSDSTGSTDASTTVSGDTSPSESSTSDGTTTSGSEETATPSGTTTKDSDKTTTPSGSTTTDSGKTTTPGGPTDKVSGETTTPSGSTAEDSGETTTSSGSTAEDSGETTTPGGSTTTPSGPTVSDDGVSTTTISTGTDDISSTIESSTFSGSTETEAGGSSLSTVEGVSGSTTEYSSTATGGETTTSGSTGSDSTTESGATEGTTGTETGSTDSSIQGSSTFETESGETTSWDLSTVLSTKTSRCRPRNKPAKCKTSKFGCCPDKKTPAGGPFDEGCPSPTTCKDTKYGCCPDGVSPAGGPRNRDCPVPNCKETLYGCCKSDRKTPAEGNDQEGCPPACKFSKHGCCADNETQATGPNHAGCPETSTTTTESPTETTTDSDVSSEPGFTDSTEETATETTTTETSTEAVTEKCEIINGTEVCHPCSTTEFGCCDDGETAAHGANKLGCCLLTPHGCCPDNYQAATGPNLEGCDCKNAPFGCCPDQKSYASGPNNTGCGCEHSTHGCCPDRHTEATGPDFEGCSCHTYQFGCCPDGKTAAVGFNLQGCRCEESKHGCCGDGVTPATGPNQEGCDCASSKFGCCPDGVTESKSKNFTGCAEALVNRQAACGLPYEQGSCTNYSIQWFYDNDYGGCSRFHYGGCEGNGNRFASKEECTDVCIQPAPRDACHLPKVKGSCTKEVVVRWYYDDNYQRCLQFHYSNCLGNANNFKTQEECDKQCSPKLDEEGQCQLPIDEGPCAGNYSRWGYNETTQRCEEFLWGGCQGNPNRFSSEAACMLKCNPPGKKQPVCDQPQDAGNCTQNNPYWAFSKDEDRCVPFYYGGCGGNENRFSDQKQCEDACPKSFEKDKCTLPASPGDCRQFQLRWFFDTKHKQCRQFPYGGCGGNDNNFLSEDLCKSECSRTTTPPPAPTQDICSLPPEVGPCRAAHLRYYFNPSTRRCDPFTYGGCEGNQNNFHSVQECEQRCAPPPATPPPNIPPECRVGSLEECRGVGRLWYLEPSSGRCTPYDPQPGAPSCSLPGIFSSPEACERACGDFRDIDPCKLRPSAGNCSDTVESWYYDEERDQCGEFYYTGCGGNENRFPSKEECEGRCKVGAEPEPQCRTPESLQPCGEPRAAFHYDHAAGRCVQSEIGGCNHPNKYSTEEECLRSCGDFKGIDVCREPLHPGSCRQPTQKFYWNLREGRCDSYTYSGCEGGANRFSNEAECQQVCGHLAIDPSENEVADCDAARAECASLRCDYGTSKTRDANGCDRCTCITHPCETLQCPADQRCVVNVEYDAATGSTQYVGDCGVVEKPGTCPAGAEEDSSACHVECNDDADCRGADKCCGSGCSRLCRAPDAVHVPADCSAEKARCSSLQCELSVQKTRGPDGCEHCECVRPEPNCQPFADECRALKCNYGPISRTTDADGCERCTCIAHPCEGKRCPEGQRCTVTASYDGPSGSTQYTGDCAIVNKPGTCPAEQAALSTCHVECNDDADCRGVQKCCSSGCSRLCRAPAGPENAVRGPLVPQAPEPNTETEHEVSSSEGGMATLRCLFHSNPPPRITWRKGEITIDGNQGRFRLTSDGALQIVSLYRNDTGVYICVAENELGTSEQEIELRVDGPVEAPAGIVGESESEVVGDIGQGLRVRCLAYGFPTPTIAWHHRPTGEMVPYDSSKYEARGNELLIKSLGLDTLGEYTCQVYNGLGKPVSWQVTVRAAHADASWPSSPYLVQRGAPPPARTEPPAAPPARDYSPYVEIPAVPPQFTVPVRTSIQAQQTALATGGRLELSCDVDGHPEPRVFWTKDNVQLAESDRIYFTPARLSISRLVEEDAGVYGCHADNGHSAHHSVVQISVQKLYIPELCKDNQYFADCKLIVRSNLCRHEYYSKFCCKSCVEANALDPQTLEFQGDSAWTYKKK